MSNRYSMLVQTLFLLPLPPPDLLGLGGGKYQPPSFTDNPLILPWHLALLLAYLIFSGIAGSAGCIPPISPSESVGTVAADFACSSG